MVHTVLESPELTATLRGLPDPVWNLTISPDGRTAAMTQAGAVTLWDIGTKTERTTLKGELSVPFRSAFAPDGNTLAVAYFSKEGKGGGIGLWDVASGKQLAMLRRREPADTYGLAYTSDGKLIATREAPREGDESKAEIVLWDVPSRTVHSAWPLKAAAATLALSPDGTLFVPVYTRMDGRLSGSQIRRWNVAAKKELASLSDENRDAYPIHLMAVSPDGKLVAGPASDRDIQVWDVARSVHLPARRKEFPRRVYALAFGPDTKPSP